MTSSNSEIQVEKLSFQLLEQAVNSHTKVHEQMISITQELSAKYDSYLPYFRQYTSPSVLNFLAEIEQKYILYNSYIHSIYIVDFTNQTVFSSLNYTLQPLSEPQYSDLAALEAKPIKLGVQFQSTRKGISDVVTYYSYTESASGGKGVILVNSLQNDVVRWQELMMRRNQGYFYVTDEELRPLYVSGRILFEEFRRSGRSTQIQAPNEGHADKASLLGKEFLLLHQQAANRSLRYFLFVPKDTFTKAAFKDSFVFLLVGFLCLLASSAGVLWAVSYLYKPIQRLASRLQPTKQPIDDPFALDGMLHALMGEKEHLHDIVKHNRYDLMQRLLERILAGKWIREGVERLRKLQIGFPHVYFTVVTIEKCRQHHIRDELTNMDAELLVYGMGNIGEELLGTVGIAKAVLLQDRYAAIIVNHDRELSVSEWKELCQHVRAYIRQYLKVDAGVGIGRTKWKHEDISLSYEESVQALSVNHLVEDGLIMHVDEWGTGESDVNGMPLFTWASCEEAYAECIRAANRAGLESLVTHVRKAALERQAKPQDIYMLAMQSMGTCMRLCKEFGLSFEALAVESERLVRLLQQTQRLNDVTEAILHMGTRLIELLDEKKQSIRHAMVQRAEAVIRSNLGWGIEQIAEHLYISASYMSKLFKEETGITIGEFMVKEKMESAKRLLVETNTSVQDIAERVGYSTSRGFYKQFKESTGLTPSEYRKLTHVEAGGAVR